MPAVRMYFEVPVRTLLSFQELTFTVLGDLEGICLPIVADGQGWLGTRAGAEEAFEGTQPGSCLHKGLCSPFALVFTSVL